MSDASELEIARQCHAARSRLERRSGLGAPVHFRRPAERPFTAEERGRVTILYGGLTERHDRLAQSALRSCGYKSQPLPQPDLAGYHAGREYCDNGVCNPAYFTIGTLVRYLQQLEASGMSRREIVDNYVFFTAGSCGPCRFGMYESQYRIALRNAGFDGFRVLLFQQDDGVRASTGERGLQFTLRFGLNVFDAFTFGDALQAFGYAIRPYELVAGATDQRLEEATAIVASAIERREDVRASDLLPAAFRGILRRGGTLTKALNVTLNVRDHVRGSLTRDTLAACRDVLAQIEVDRLRVKPVVKATGEFWAQTTEGDGNFRMFSFLEAEGAHVLVEPLMSWVTYLLQQVRARTLRDCGLDADGHASPWTRARVWCRDGVHVVRRSLLIALAERILHRHHERLRQGLGGAGHLLADQKVLAALADPHYRSLARGGEGHLEVAKNIYYTTHRAAHMVLSLKPFGCMPSTQSDGVQSAVVERFREMLYVPVETAADGELAAQSRVQIALVEARARAEAEFDRILTSTGRRLEDIEAYVADHPELRRATYPVRQHEEVTGAAAQFVLHVARLMAKDRRRRAAIRTPRIGEVTR